MPRLLLHTHRVHLESWMQLLRRGLKLLSVWWEAIFAKGEAIDNVRDVQYQVKFVGIDVPEWVWGRSIKPSSLLAVLPKRMHSDFMKLATGVG